MFPFRSKASKKKSNTSADPFTDEASIGNILMRMGSLTKEQLQRALGQKAYHDDMVLGGLLKQMGLCTDAQVARALTIQARLRSGEKAMAELELLEERVAKYGEGEKQIHDEIEESRKEARDRGEQSGVWLLPVKEGV